MPLKIKRGDPLGFFNIHSVAKLKKIEGGPLGDNFSEKKSHSAEKNWKRDSLVCSSIVSYAGNLFGSVPWANGYNLASSFKSL